VAYLAPEALRKEEPVGPTADVFTVGVLLWEMLQNKRLFGGLSFSAVSAKVLEQKITAADAGRAPGSTPVSTALVAVAAKALERDPAARYGTAAEMAAAIRAAGDDVATSAQAAALVEQLAGRTIAGYRNSIAKGPVPKAAPAPAPAAAAAAAEPSPAPETGSDQGAAAAPVKDAPKPAGDQPPATKAEDEAKDSKKLPPPKVGGAAASDKLPPKKPALPAMASAGIAEEVSFEDASSEAEAAARAEPEPETLEKEHPAAEPAVPKTEGGPGPALAKVEAKAEEPVPGAPIEARTDADEVAAAEPKAVPRLAEAGLADEPLSDAAVLSAEDKIELPKESSRKGLLLVIVGAVLVVAIIVVAYSQLGGSGMPERTTPSASAAATAASSSLATVAATETAAPPSASVPEPAPTATATDTASATPEQPPEPTATASVAAAPPHGKPAATAKPSSTGGGKPKPTGTPTKKYMPPDL
jgi:hypothetical protein